MYLKVGSDTGIAFGYYDSRGMIPKLLIASGFCRNAATNATAWNISTRILGRFVEELLQCPPKQQSNSDFASVHDHDRACD